MATVKQIEKQIEDLQKQKQKLVDDEREIVIAAIKEQIAIYDIKATELGIRTKRGRGAAKTKRAPVQAKYQGPNGELWSGRGRRPAWAVEAGNKLSKYLIP